MRSISAQFDARLWGFIIVGALSAGAVFCIGLAASAQASTIASSAGIISVSETLREIDARGAAAQRAARNRQGVMIERLPSPDLSVATAPDDSTSP
jgi:hypothetical protein